MSKEKTFNKPRFQEAITCPKCGKQACALEDGTHCIIWCQSGHVISGGIEILSMTPKQIKTLEQEETATKGDIANLLKSIIGGKEDDSDKEYKAEQAEIDKYLIGHQASGLKAGDQVTVLSKAMALELGWCNSWEPEMDKLVGNTYPILRDFQEKGFLVDSPERPYCLPYFILEKAEVKA